MLFRRISVLLFIVCLVFVGCAPVTNPGSGGAKIISNKIPLVGFANASATRAVVPSTTTSEDINYLLNCPAVTGFNSSAEGLVDGQVLSAQSFLDTTVTFTTSAFSGGVNSIETGTRFTGVLGDGSGSIVVELDSDETEFWFEEKLFVDDPDKIVISDHSQSSKSVVYVTASGTIGTDNSVIGTCSLAFFTVLSGGTELLGVAPQCELYAGPWNSSTPDVIGSGVAFLEVRVTTSPSATYGSASKPTGVLDSSKVATTIEYLKGFADSGLTYTPQYTVFYKSSADAHSIRYADSWNGVTVNSASLAKANLPSDYWIEKSSLDTF